MRTEFASQRAREHTLFEPDENDDFTVKATDKPEEVKSYLEVGFEYVCQKDNLVFLRKRT